jgi:alkaline phosphatase D
MLNAPTRTPASSAAIDPSRRLWLRGAVAVAGLGMTGVSARILAPTRWSADPFSLGVASGDPATSGAILWTRLAPQPLAIDGGMPASNVAVRWEVASDDAFSRVAAAGAALARPERAHAVHVEASGLLPGREYFYRFTCGDAASATGRFRTLPPAHLPVDNFRIVVASCQHYEHGWFAAHRHIAQASPDLILHLGDYIYEGSFGERIRRHESDTPLLTLADYRARHACYKRDPDLQAAHAACAWTPIWDDHEVANDYAGELAIDGESPGAFRQRRAAAYRAWLEHMPVRAALVDGDTRIFRRLAIGNLADLHMLDDRQYRAAQACAPRDRGYAPNIAPDCPERLDTSRSLLGTAQEKWLHAGLDASNARWNLVAQQTLIAPFRRRGANGEVQVWSDAWDGYPAARERLLRHIDARHIPNVVTFGGDVHAFHVCDLKADFDDPHGPAIATEFVTSSLTTDDGDYAAMQRDLDLNPHIRYADCRARGWIEATLTPRRMDVSLRALTDARDPNARAYTLQRYSVEDGRAGAQP